jgi:L-threonylcarbamoyladenylate synthase
MLLKITDENIRRAAAALKNGELVAFPTETVYGLGADAFNPEALAYVFHVKRRPFFDPLIVHIAAFDALSGLIDGAALTAQQHAYLERLARALWPGPLTLVLPKSPRVPDLATGGLDTVAVRFPQNDVAAALIRASTGAIAAPSANPFGCLSPTRAAHVAETLGDAVNIILDGGPTAVGVESTVLDLTADAPRILRPGGTALAAFEAALGFPLADSKPAVPPENRAARSPGQLKSHYAPATRMVLCDRLAESETPFDARAAYLFFSTERFQEWREKHGAPENAERIYILSSTADTREAASALFETLHRIDRAGAHVIYAERAPETGLGAAINDRLTRASYKEP